MVGRPSETRPFPSYRAPTEFVSRAGALKNTQTKASGYRVDHFRAPIRNNCPYQKSR